MDDPALDYIRHVLKAKDWSAADLAKKAGVSHSTINRPLTTLGWKSRISRNTIQKVHAASGIDPSNFFGATEAPFVVSSGDPAPEGSALVPVYDVTVSAGHGAIVDAEDHVSNLAFSTQYLREMTSAKGRQLAAIRVKGDSMAPTIQDDDMVMVDTTKTNLDYDGLFVLRIGEALQIKRIGRGARKASVMVISDNTLYPAVDTERAEIDVIGKVIWYGRKV